MPRRFDGVIAKMRGWEKEEKYLIREESRKEGEDRQGYSMMGNVSERYKMRGTRKRMCGGRKMER